MKAFQGGIAVVATVLALLAGCASNPTAAPEPPAPPPPQNLVGATDELQLVTELALDQARTYGPEKLLVVFDIDNTLLAMEQDLGSDQWYYWQKNLEAENPCSGQLVNDRLAVQGAMFFASAMRQTQPTAAEQVKRLQDAGIPVIALTSRGPSFRLSTFRELRRNGFNFESRPWPPAAGYADDYLADGLQRPVRYEDGVAFTAGQDKGVMLQDLFRRSGQDAPLVILMADDKQDNLKDVMKAFSWSSTKVQAWRYTREDTTVAAFDPDAAAADWEALYPALMQIQQVLGPDNFEIPPQDVVPKGCGAT